MKTKDITNNQIVAIFSPYPYAGAPSQRFRYEQYLAALQAQEFHIDYLPLLDDRTHAILYKKGYILQKAAGIVRGYLRRWRHLYRARKATFVLVHREAAPLGPPVFEWLLARLLRKKIIYDFDDAIWLPNTSEANRLAAWLKWHHKVRSICQWSYKVSCGNAYLCSYAARYNPQVVLNPTTIDTEHQHNRLKDQDTPVPVIGWTGSHSTMRFLDEIVPVLQQLAARYTFKTVVIANRAPDFQLSNLTFVPWREATEMEDLLQFNIGIMPLTDDPWARGKCGFKALQYMALGIPAVVSPVGVNTEIVTHGMDGYLCSKPADWYAALERLLQDTELRQEMGRRGRAKIERRYSVRANTPNFLQLFT